MAEQTVVVPMEAMTERTEIIEVDVDGVPGSHDPPAEPMAQPSAPPPSANGSNGTHASAAAVNGADSRDAEFWGDVELASPELTDGSVPWRPYERVEHYIKHMPPWMARHLTYERLATLMRVGCGSSFQRKFAF